MVNEGKYRTIERSGDNKFQVIGVSIIQHKIRVKNNLTLREYIVLEFIRNWHFTHKEPITRGAIWKETGIYLRQMQKSMEILKNKGFLFQDTDGKVKTTLDWNIWFDGGDKQFDEVWKMHRVGNRNKAKAAFAKAVKVDTFENIKAGLVKYIEFLSVSEQFPVHLSSFFNHKNKDWQTERDVTIYKKKQETPVQQNTGPKSAFS